MERWGKLSSFYGTDRSIDKEDICGFDRDNIIQIWKYAPNIK